MPNVVRTDIDALNAVLTVELPKEEYSSKVQQDIKKYSQRAQMKGFRPGKTPQALVKKMYGSSFLMETVNEMVRKELGDYLQKENIPMIGEPIPSVEQPEFKLDLKNPEDLAFKFDIGLLPTVETLNALDNTTYERNAVIIDEADITKELDNALKRQKSEEIEVTDSIQEEDIINLSIKEVGGTLEKDLMISANWLTDDMKSVFMTQKTGDNLQINIFQLEKDTTADYVRKYFLGLEENDDRKVNETFDMTIVSVKRRKPVEMDEAFFKAQFGEDVTNEEQARAELRKMLSRNNDVQSDALVIRDIQEGLMKNNKFALPEGFLKRWLKYTNDKNSEEVIEKNLEPFMEQMRWTIIRSKVLNDAGIQIGKEDMKANYAKRVQGYFGAMGGNEEIVNMLVDRAMEDEKQYNEIYEDTMMEKFFEAVKARTNIIDKPVTMEELNSKIAAIRYEMAKQKGEIQEAEPAVEMEEVK
jgi:trigger factor